MVRGSKRETFRAILPTNGAQSARGPAQSKTWRTAQGPGDSRSVLDCGRPLPLFPYRARWMARGVQGFKARNFIGEISSGEREAPAPADSAIAGR